MASLSPLGNSSSSCGSRAGMSPQCVWLAQGLCGTDVGAAPQNTLLWHQEGPGRICSLLRKSSLLLLQQRQRRDGTSYLSSPQEDI